MDPWCRSNITFQLIEGLVHCGLLNAWITVKEWLLPSEEDVLSSLDDNVVSFAHFHECGFATLAHKFLWGLLHYYKIEL